MGFSLKRAVKAVAKAAAPVVKVAEKAVAVTTAPVVVPAALALGKTQLARRQLNGLVYNIQGGAMIGGVVAGGKLGALAGGFGVNAIGALGNQVTAGIAPAAIPGGQVASAQQPAKVGLFRRFLGALRLIPVR
jgi:hypothetical protein